MTEAIGLALIGSAQIIIVTVLGIVGTVVANRMKALKRDTAVVKSHVNEVKEQVVNHHTTNLRVENDERHRENKVDNATIINRLDVLLDLGVENRERIIALETTERMRKHDNPAEAPKPDSRRHRRERIAYSPPHPQGSGNGTDGPRARYRRRDPGSGHP